MYQPHNLFLLIPCALLCWLLAAICIMLRNEEIFKVPRFPRIKVPRFPGIFGIAFLGIIVLMFGVREYDDYRFRAELRDISPDRMQHICLIKQRTRREIVDASEVSELMSRIQSLKSIGAHHSHPTDPFEITFLYAGQEYLYTIGRDSERPNEYWVNADSREDDIGRIRSDDLGQIVQRLLAGKQ